MGRTRFLSRRLWDSGCISFFSRGINRLRSLLSLDFIFVAHPVFHRYFLHVLRVGSDVGGDACSTRDLPSPGVQKHASLDDEGSASPANTSEIPYSFFHTPVRLNRRKDVPTRCCDL